MAALWVAVMVERSAARSADWKAALKAVISVVVMVELMAAHSVARWAGSLVASKDASWVVLLDASTVERTVFGSAVCWVASRDATKAV